MLKRRTRILFLISLVALIGFLKPKYIVKAGEQIFDDPKVNSLNKIDFENGSFEIPVIVSGDNIQGSMDNVPGWFTVPVKESEKNHPYAYYIELQKDGIRDGGMVHYAAPESGTQWAELNCELEGMLYQDCNTMPGQKVYYHFYHKGRLGFDVMNFFLFNADETMPDANERILQCRTNQTWKLYKGAYIIPDGQTKTRFAFQSESSSNGNKTMGNYLDGLSLQYPSFLSVEETILTSDRDNAYALLGEVIRYLVIVRNEGETDASRTVLTNMLPDGLEYVAGSAKINGEDAGNLVSYENDEVRINLGKGATAGKTVTNGGIVEVGTAMAVTFDVKITSESGSPGDVIFNQAKVTYNDEGHEDEPANLDGENNVSEKKSFVLKDRSVVDGTIWIDRNNNGMINDGERRVHGATVELVDGLGAVANDVNGVPLRTQADNNGNYSFNAIPEGSYYVQYTHPGYQTSIAIGDNQARPVNGQTASQTSMLDFTADLRGDLHQVLIKDKNIGVLPILNGAKTMMVNGVDNPGTAWQPVEVTENSVLVYIIKVHNQASAAEDIVTADIIDLIPNGLSIDEGGIVPTGASVNAQRVTWSDFPLSPGVNFFYIPVKAETHLAAFFENYAEINAEKERNEIKGTNKTYHYKEMLNVEFDIIKKLSESARQKEQFLFRIEYWREETSTQRESVFYGIIDIPQGESEARIHFKDMPGGIYQIEEMQDNWRYEITGPAGRKLELTSMANSYGEVTFTNRKINDKWLGVKKSVTNVMERVR